MPETVVTPDDFQKKFTETVGHQTDLANAKTDAVAKHTAANSANAAAAMADAAIVSDQHTLDADKAELHSMVDALFGS